ncbi:unnamed protein product [Durusdinium trenchii]|uniref:N-acetyltransferase domain-containing protein n=1 Tax=Durusdinium trenchii TaxID=1381693 RepID=A0ABP0RAR4_9DINO
MFSFKAKSSAAKPAAAEEVQGVEGAASLRFEELNRKDLSSQAHESDLQELFGLLRCSHYKTKPSDLRCFLDTPQLRWFALRSSTCFLGLGIAAVEEPLSEELAEAVYLRQLKVPPQLMAQTLSSEAGFKDASRFRYARVLRLCVHPALQRRGLGSDLLKRILEKLRKERVDAVGACFGLKPWLLKLWRRSANTRLVWIAHGSEPSSGHHSATVLEPLSTRCIRVVERLQERLALQMPELLLGPLQHLDLETVAAVMAALPPLPPSPFRAQDAEDVRSFAFGARNLSCCRFALARAVLAALRVPRARLADRFEDALLDMLQGREANDSILRQAIRQLIADDGTTLKGGEGEKEPVPEDSRPFNPDGSGSLKAVKIRGRASRIHSAMHWLGRCRVSDPDYSVIQTPLLIGYDVTHEELTEGTSNVKEQEEDDQEVVGEPEDRLPRSSPFVGALRHAPKRSQILLLGQLDRLLRRRIPELAELGEDQESHGDAFSSIESSEKLPSSSPYVGFQRHAPPSSPVLSFTASPGRDALGISKGLPELDLKEVLPGELPEEVWTEVMRLALDVPELAAFSRVSMGFHKVVSSPDVWCQRVVRLPPSCLENFAPQLDRWLAAWTNAKKLVLPRSNQLLEQVNQRAPHLPIEVSWRFDRHLKGEGVEVLRHGQAVRRVAEEELVVLGDAALPCDDRWPYLEVHLDECGEGIGDMINDFGFGVTASVPEEIDELGSVADEVPRSWVVDFTQSMVCLSVNNREASQGKNLSAAALREGCRVGLLVKPNAFEIYIDGVHRDTLTVRPEDCVPVNSGLYPVLDLYGRTIEISKTDAEELELATLHSVDPILRTEKDLAKVLQFDGHIAQEVSRFSCHLDVEPVELAVLVLDVSDVVSSQHGCSLMDVSFLWVARVGHEDGFSGKEDRSTGLGSLQKGDAKMLKDLAQLSPRLQHALWDHLLQVLPPHPNPIPAPAELTVKPLNADFGALVTSELSAERLLGNPHYAQQLFHAWQEHGGLLVMRNLDLTPQQMVAISAFFGEVEDELDESKQMFAVGGESRAGPPMRERAGKGSMDHRRSLLGNTYQT